MRLSFTVAGLALTLIAGPALAESSVYSVVKDFSITSNPNGVWTYLTASPGQGHRLGITTSALNGIPNWLAWIDQRQPPHTTEIARNATGDVIRYGSIVAPKNEIMVNPQDNDVSIVKFTAPARGSYRIDAEFQGIDKYEASHTVSINTRRRMMLSSRIDAYQQTVEYHHYLKLGAGDYVEFLTYSTAGKTPPKSTATGLFLKIKGPLGNS